MEAIKKQCKPSSLKRYMDMFLYAKENNQGVITNEIRDKFGCSHLNKKLYPRLVDMDISETTVESWIKIVSDYTNRIIDIHLAITKVSELSNGAGSVKFDNVLRSVSTFNIKMIRQAYAMGYNDAIKQLKESRGI